MSPPTPPPSPGGGEIRQKSIQTDNEDVSGFWDKLQFWDDNFERVQKIVDSMQPDKLNTAAGTYDSLAKRMETTIDLLYKQAERMREAWGSEDAARKAYNNLNKAYRQAVQIQTVSQKTHQALKAHAQQQTQWKQQYGTGGPTDNWRHDVKRWATSILALNPTTAPASITSFLMNNMDAADAMNEINNGTVQSNDRFPEEIRSDMPTVSADDDLGRGPGDPGGKPPGTPKMPGGGDPPGGMPKTPGGPGNPDIPGPGNPNLPGGPDNPNLPGGPNGPGNPNIPGGPNGPGGPGNLPGGPGGPGSDLASMPGGGGPGLGGGGVPGGPGLGGGAPGGGLPGGAPGAGALGSAGAPGAFAGPGAFGRNGMGGAGGPMGMPMGAGAGAGGGQNNERERSTWLTEDEDVWGGNDETAPPVIG